MHFETHITLRRTESPNANTLDTHYLSGIFSFKIFLLNGLTMSIVGRSERSDLRHGNLNVLGHVGGRYARSDLQYSSFIITVVI